MKEANAEGSHTRAGDGTRELMGVVIKYDTPLLLSRQEWPRALPYHSITLGSTLGSKERDLFDAFGEAASYNTRSLKVTAGSPKWAGGGARADVERQKYLMLFAFKLDGTWFYKNVVKKRAGQKIDLELRPQREALLTYAVVMTTEGSLQLHLIYVETPRNGGDGFRPADVRQAMIRAGFQFHTRQRNAHVEAVYSSAVCDSAS